MPSVLLESTRGVTIVGAGDASSKEIANALRLAPVLVAADGGAEIALNSGFVPQAVIGDMDSLPAAVRAKLPDSSLHQIEEQDSTDFDKCLRSVSAPRFIAVGVAGPRLDHGLVALNTLVRHPQKHVLMLAGDDVAFMAPRSIELRLPPGTRVSLFALSAVTGRSRGLKWSIEGIAFAPDGRTGTSNVAVAEVVTLEFESRGMLLIMPSEHLGAAAAALEDSGFWSGD